jgi:hypothetical protein
VGPQELERTPEQEEIIDRLARKIVDRQLTVPAIMLLESIKPASFLGTQVMAFLDPFAKAVFNYGELDLYRRTFEDRRNVEELIRRIERFDAELRLGGGRPGEAEESGR